MLYHHQVAGGPAGALQSAAPLPRSFLRVRSVAVIESLLTEYERPLPLSTLCALHPNGSTLEQLELVLVDKARCLWLARKNVLPLTHTHSARAMLWNVAGMQVLTSAAPLLKSDILNID